LTFRCGSSIRTIPSGSGRNGALSSLGDLARVRWARVVVESGCVCCCADPEFAPEDWAGPAGRVLDTLREVEEMTRTAGSPPYNRDELDAVLAVQRELRSPGAVDADVLGLHTGRYRP